MNNLPTQFGDLLSVLLYLSPPLFNFPQGLSIPSTNYPQPDINELLKLGRHETNDDKQSSAMKSSEEFVYTPKPKRNKKKVKSFMCNYENCGKCFDYKWILERHMNSHFSFKLFKCEYDNCDKAYKSKENLNLHVKNKHLNIKPYECQYCKSQFSHRNGKFNLFYHI
jgi:uncharacterized Zn-finger protein